MNRFSCLVWPITIVRFFHRLRFLHPLRFLHRVCFLRLPCLAGAGSAVLSLAMLTPLATAAPYWGEVEIEAHWDEVPIARAPSPGTPGIPPAGQRSPSDYPAEFALVASFLDIWQVSDPGPDFGGIREGEHLPSIIQTDNTSEAIWVWSRYYELTGDDQYAQNIQDAWQYSMTYPAYLEEGGSTSLSGYYRMYNCGWAVRAERKYREIYGDDTYKAYGDSCASYIYYHTLSRPGAGFYHYVNPPVLAWAAGNLHEAGVAESRPDWREQALVEGRKVKQWVEGEPTLLGNETWAMSGGATMWGLLNSFFQERPDSIPLWVPLYKSELDEFSDPGDFQTAWNGWYALGHRATGLALGDPDHLGIHIALTDYLVAEDADLDGGIPAKPQDTDEMDQTWVANYMACFGLTDALGPTSSTPDVQTSLRDVVLLPNPSQDRTSIRFQLDHAAPVTVAIHDVMGRRLAVLTDGRRPAGFNEILWDGSLDRGGWAPAGLYFASITTPEMKVDRPLVRLTR